MKSNKTNCGAVSTHLKKDIKESRKSIEDDKLLMKKVKKKPAGKMRGGY